MRITFLTVGSRGDVQPLLAFALGLTAAGHEVTFAAFPKFERMVRAAGLEYAPLAEGRTGDSGAGGRERVSPARTRRGRTIAVGFLQDRRSVARERLADAIAACEHAEAVVAVELAMLLAWQVAEHLELPLVRARLSPPPPIAGRPIAGAARQAAWLAVRPWLGSGRSENGLGRLPLREPLGQLDARRTLELYAFSPAVVPDPARSGPWTHITGFWFFDGALDPEPSAELREFLDAGPAPVCVGFGAMADDDPAAVSALVHDALARAGRRGVLVGGLAGDGEPARSSRALAVEAVSHSWLLERCAAAVHHGGAGTTAAALRAGVPSVIVPQMIDQHGWGRRIAALGAGPRPLPRRKLSAERLAGAIRAAIEQDGLREHARSLGARIRAEDGIASAVEVFERHMEGVAAPAPTEVINS
ncbi:MAG TPA: glycosyltransferase [Solirubrobacteraceae bacterium]|nr:glycosyltransferase [Solirubrobacteraceae bacterium]